MNTTPATQAHDCPHTRMEQWNPTWKHHHSPMWFKKLVRRWAKKNQIGGPGWDIRNLLPKMFDHWGSFKVGGEVRVATQPYVGNLADATQFAEALGCKVVLGESPAPWHPATKMFVFQEGDPVLDAAPVTE